MTKKKPSLPPTTAPLNPHFIYRKGSATAQAVIGLAGSQINEAIEKGDVPPPVALTSNGRARGWTGQQLIDLQHRRVAQAEAERQARLLAREQNTNQGIT